MPKYRKPFTQLNEHTLTFFLVYYIDYSFPSNNDSKDGNASHYEIIMKNVLELANIKKPSLKDE